MSPEKFKEDIALHYSLGYVHMLLPEWLLHHWMVDSLLDT